MEVPTSIRAAEIEIHLKPNDALLPAADHRFADSIDPEESDTRFVVATEQGFGLSESPRDATNLTERLSDSQSISRLVETLRDSAVRRVLYTVFSGGDSPEALRSELRTNGIELVEVVIQSPDDDEHPDDVDLSYVVAADFMPEEDAELVAQRLRELGYL